MFKFYRQKIEEKKFRNRVSNFCVNGDLNIDKSIIILLKKYINQLEQMRIHAKKNLGINSNRQNAALFAIFYNFLSSQENVHYFYNNFNKELSSDQYGMWYMIQKELPNICQKYRNIVLKEDNSLKESEKITEEEFLELYNNYRIIYNPKILEDAEFIVNYLSFFIYDEDFQRQIMESNWYFKDLDSYDVFREFDEIKEVLQEEMQTYELNTLHLFDKKEFNKLAVAKFLKETFFNIAFSNEMALGTYVYFRKSS